MSVYNKEKGDYLRQALESVLINQTVKPSEVVIVKDGPLTDELEEVLSNFYSNYSDVIKIVSLSENSGLGKALNFGLSHCTNEIVARVDTDDINDKYRFEKQLEIFSRDSDVDLVGGNIAEFFDSKDNVKFVRKVPSANADIKKRIKRRNPINHMSVMFKKGSVLNVGGYMHLPYMEDYYLWVRMLANNCKFINVDNILVFARTGDEMFLRRSNPEQIKSWKFLQKEMQKFSFTNRFDYFINSVNIVMFVYFPPKLKKYIYKYILRK